MAGKIRGITIELGGDTKGLVKSLNDASKSVKGVQTQLKDVNKLLKVDPKNTELLRQKQDLLRQQVEKTKNALDQQKKALQELKNADNSQKTIDQQNALQREIIETEQKLKNAEKEFKTFGSVGAQQVKAVGEQVKVVGEQVTKVGEGLTKGLTVPIAAVGAGSVKAFSEVDVGLDNVTKKTGATGAELENMQEIMKNLATQIPTDFATAGNAVGEINTRFGITGDELSALSEQFVKFAQLNNQDVVTAVDQSQKALAAYGMSADEAGNFLDTMNKVSQMTGVSVDKLQSGIVSNATSFQEMGLSIDRATLFMGQLEKSGTNSETVLNGMRKALKNATKEGKPLSQALEELEDGIKNGTDSMDGLSLAYDLFGKSGDQIYGAIQNGTLSFKDLASASLEAGGNINETFENTLDPITEFKTTMNELKVAGSELGTVLLDFLRPAIEKISEAIGTFSNWWKSLSPEMQNTIVKVAMVVAAIGPLVAIIGKVISLVGTIMTLAPMLSTAIGLITGPIGLVIAAVAAVIAIGVALYKNWDEVKAKATEIWEKIKKFFVDTLNAIKAKFTEIWNNIKTFISTTIESIKTKISETWTAIKTSITETITAIKTKITEIWNGIKTAISSTVDGIKTKITETWTNIKTKVSETVNNIKTNLSEKWNNIKETASTKWNDIKGKITSAMDSAKTALGTKLEGIKSLMSNRWETMKSLASSAFTTIGKFMTDPIGTAKETISKVLNTIKNFFPLSIGRIFSDIKLPHFSVTGEFPYGIGGKGVKPSFSIEWYAQAARAGAIFNREALFGFGNGHFYGAGDSVQPELLIGTNTLSNMIASAVAQGMNSGAIYNAVLQGASNAHVSVYIDGKDVTGIVNKYNTSQQLNRMRLQGI